MQDYSRRGHGKALGARYGDEGNGRERGAPREEAGEARAARAFAGPAPSPTRRLTPLPSPEKARTATALPPGHVRKKSTGELGKVQAIDSKAGTVTVRWLRGGATSTVPLSSVSRR